MHAAPSSRSLAFDEAYFYQLPTKLQAFTLHRDRKRIELEFLMSNDEIDRRLISY